MVRANKILTFFLIFFFITITLNSATGTVAADEPNPILNPVAWGRWLKNQIIDAIRSTPRRVVNEIRNQLGGAWDFITDLPSTVGEFIGSISDSVVNSIQSSLGGAWDFLTDLPSTTAEFIKDIANTVWNKIMLLPQTAVDTVVTLFNWLETTLYNLADSIEAQVPGQFAAVALPAAAALYVTSGGLIVYGLLYIYKLIPVIG